MSKLIAKFGKTAYERYLENPVTLLELVQHIAELRLNYVNKDDAFMMFPHGYHSSLNISPEKLKRLNFADSDLIQLAIKLVYGHKDDYYAKDYK